MGSTPHETSDLHISARPRDSEARLPVGTRVLDGRIEVVAELARGGMGVVYEAVDHATAGMRVALKVVTAAADGPDTVARFQNEARLARGLANRPGVVAPLGVGQLDGPEGFEGRSFLLAVLVEGESLAAIMRRHRTGLAQRRALALARDVARVLADLHEHGIVHRDVKPGNVMVTSDGGVDHVHLIDFGLAYATGDGWAAKSPDLTVDGQAPGTTLYMSAEQAAHLRPAPAMDMYSLGVTLYEMLAGDPPFHGMGDGEMFAHKFDRNRKPYPIEKICDDVPASVAALVDRCIGFDPADRPTALEFAATLDAVLMRPSLRVVEHGDDGPLGSIDPDERVELSIEDVRQRLAAAAERAAVREATRSATPAEAELAGSDDRAQEHARVEADPGARNRWWIGGAVVGGLALVLVAWGLGTGGGGGEVGVEDYPAAAIAGTGPRESEAEPSSAAEDGVAPARDLGPEQAATSGGEQEPAPAVAPPHPEPATPPTSPSQVKAKPSAPKDDEARRCAAVVEQARQAAERSQWQDVLRLTKSAKCFRPDLSDERRRLRINALGETRRYAECVALGKGSSDPAVVRVFLMCTNAEAAKEETR